VNTMWLNHAGLGVSDHEGHVSPAYRAYWISDEFIPQQRGSPSIPPMRPRCPRPPQRRSHLLSPRTSHTSNFWQVQASK
jgi:hypothetical protein